MYLKTLTLRGFKSFAATTVLEFEPGTNAVVGPNGSGKSNVVDAISWVLGEQGTKNLRAGSMSDVIFSGAGQKSALGRAQVTLTIDNSDDALPLAPTEVEISRTVFRNGGSEYTINGESARLADVQQLIASAHLGKSKHSIITQGHIERVLNASATERRELIEEAAGISAYRLRAEQTEKKLASMKANLNRLEDLEAELSSQLEPLGEQAEAARSAREVQARIRGLRLALSAAEARGVQIDRLAVQGRADELGLSLAAAEKKSWELSQTVTDRQKDTEAKREAIENLRRETQRLERVLATTSQVAAVAQERLRKGAPLPTEELEEEVAKARSQVEVHVEKARQTQKTTEEAEHEKDKSQLQLDEVIEVTSQLEVDLANLEKAREDHRQLVAELTQDLARAKANLDRARDEANRRADEENTAAAAIKDFDLQADRVQVRLAGLQAESQELQTAEAEAGKRREKASAAVQDATEALNQAQLVRESVSARAQTLAESLPAELEFSDAALLTQITVEQGWHTALGVALGKWDRAATTGERAGTGRWQKLGAKAAELAANQWQLPAETPNFLTPARKLVTAPRQLQESLKIALYGVYLHDALSKEQEQELADFLDQNPLVRAICGDGTLRTSYGELPARAETGALELYAKSREAEERLEEARASEDARRHDLASAQKLLADAREAEKEAARASGVLSAKVSGVKAELERVHTKAEAAEESLNLLADRAKKAEEKQAEAEKAYASAQKTLETGSKPGTLEDPAELRQQLEAKREEIKTLQAQTASLHANYHVAQEQVKAAESLLDQLKDLLSSREKSLADALAHNEKLAVQKTAAEATRDRALKLATALEKTLSEISRSINQEETEQEQLQAQVKQSQDAAAQQKKLLESLRTQATSLTIQLGALNSQWEVLEAKAQEDLGETLEDILEGAGNQENFDPEIAQNQLIDEQKALAAIGAVNPLALEEYRALSERHSYLAEQIKDLKASRADLRAIIKELNERINREFTVAFTDTASHFEKIFARLFPGGEGSLSLTDPGDVLNTGVEIHAKPAGKKVKRISLLSGGERALASLALLTAIFAARPTPFYVLDEVDAALDDRNLGRLLEVFEELAENSQLIIITHKTRTIEIADTMYGISMKDGVSLVLKQSLEQLRNSLRA